MTNGAAPTPRVPGRRRLRAAAAATALAMAAVPAAARPATAASCEGPFRYAHSSNTLYVTGASVTLSDVVALCPGAPVRLVDRASGTWQLDADLQLHEGAGLTLRSRARGGDVDVLRLLSGPGGTRDDVVSITAYPGTIVLDGVTVTSWDPATAGPDTDHAVPSGGTRGRAFIRALSVLVDGVPRESRMDIVDSDVGYLGYYGAEAYGVAYKARGCGLSPEAQEVCDVLDVHGRQLRSRFHHNFMGTYTWGALGMEFRDNEYDHNVSYGLDPHDDSDHLVVTGNSFHDNGNHGFICSQRCDHLTVTDNVSYDNGHVPWVGPGDDDPSDNQVHGIMLHRGVTDTVVARNRVWGHSTGAGIAVFDSHDDAVVDNEVWDNKYGLRFSVGARDLDVRGNVVRSSGAYAVFTYRGSDDPVYTGTSGRPSDIRFADNVFSGSGKELMKLKEADRLTFTGGSIAGPASSGPRVDQGTGHVWGASVSRPSPELRFVLRGADGAPTSVHFAGIPRGEVPVSVDTWSTATWGGTPQ